MDDSFELEYADELEALGNNDEDIEIPSFNRPKSKRTLQFNTPKSKYNRLEGNDDDNFFLHEFQNVPSSPSSPRLEIDMEENNKNRKRAQNSNTLHEDIEDILYELPTLTSLSKRRRIKEQQVDESTLESQVSNSPTAAAIKQIQQHRHEKICSQLVTQSRMQDAEDLERPRVRKHIPNSDFISAVGYDGQRVYMKLWDEDVLESEYTSIGTDSRAIGLLTTPVCLMREMMEEEQSRKLFAESEALDKKVRSLLNDNEKESDNNMVESTELEVNKRYENGDVGDVNKLTEDMKLLWVEKYAPKKYTDLLSEEAINRSLLHWLKLWDFVVFGKDIPKPTKKAGKAEKEKDKKFKKKIQFEVTEVLDKHNRPEQKIALLCGPPGLGKTTLAHIVATHAGYNVVEMNASDDRSVEVFKNKIESATQMKSVMEADPRPNCLIIDEIDGAPGPAINVLLNTIKMTENETAGAKKKKGHLLMRPIICVCNDQYVPALRQLRQMALILNFPQTESSKLASRLHEVVVKTEMLKADLNALLALCEKTDNDIRSCLNTLQFVRQKQKELTLRDVQTMHVGQKDSQKSLFSVWHDVFTMQRVNKNRFVSIHDLVEGKQDGLQTNTISLSSRFEHILHMCQSAGEYDRIMQGLHENYLEAKSKDPRLSGLNLVNEWLCYADLTNHYVARSQDYSVVKYSSFLPIVFHFLYASYSPFRVQFPHSQSDAHQKLIKTNNLLTTMVTDMSPIVRKFSNPQSLVLDLLPPLLDILQPTLRPVNTQLYSNREKEELSNVVKIMISYNMTYHQEKTPEGQYVYALEPNVEEVVKFPGLKQRKQLTYAAKQMIAREIDLEKMRRSESSVPKSVEPVTVEKKEAKPSSSLPNHLKKLEAKSVAPEKPSFNFFGNFVKTKRERPAVKEDAEPKQDISKKDLLDTLIWFHFKEGFSNAVRRNVKVQDLL
ncbi:unnamed protein product [Lymnaea stagnalis]|uniref:AAA+ ATPase domain-containing protein n=1 Tax=Lymnaea stagnalis TaxID=6523 RepID=A0AAV2ILF3_LYMST